MAPRFLPSGKRARLLAFIVLAVGRKSGNGNRHRGEDNCGGRERHGRTGARRFLLSILNSGFLAAISQVPISRGYRNVCGPEPFRFELFIPIRECLEELIPIVASVFQDSR